MSKQCNSTGTWFSVDWILSQLLAAEKWANDKYDTDLEAAIVKRIGKTIPVEGWKGLLLRRKRLTTRDDAIKIVKFSDDGFWYPLEYSLRTSRDTFINSIEALRSAANTAAKADIQQLFVSKADMVYLS